MAWNGALPVIFQAQVDIPVIAPPDGFWSAPLAKQAL
jgi:hypothetical protein